MIAIAIEFTAGRYHATAWGRHVNEADAPWPPEPWRILRALIAVARRKMTGDQCPEHDLLALVETLAQSLPTFHLPPASHTHKRHYMPSRNGKKEKKTLVFDSWLQIEKGAPLIAAWENISLSPRQISLLEAILARMDYFGRSESWATARICREPELPDFPLNCFPEHWDGPKPADFSTEPVSTLAALPPEEFRRWRDSSSGVDIPANLLEALQMETADMQKQGWSKPPGSRSVVYHRPDDSFSRQPSPKPTFLSLEHPDTARFLVRGAPLPRLEDSLRIGELSRLAVMGVAGKLLGKENVPPALSGHRDRPGSPHEHAFFLQEAENGRIRHLLVHAPMGFDMDCLMVFLSLKRIYERGGNEWGLVLEALGRAPDFEPFSALCAESRAWRSVTPYLHPWHRKKGFGVEDQVRRECRRRGYPEIAGLTPVESLETAGRSLRPVHFRRFRRKRGLTQPDRNGGFWKIEFCKPLRGPLSLGFACHFGLGLFEPDLNIATA